MSLARSSSRPHKTGSVGNSVTTSSSSSTVRSGRRGDRSPLAVASSSPLERRGRRGDTSFTGFPRMDAGAVGLGGPRGRWGRGGLGDPRRVRSTGGDKGGGPDGRHELAQLPSTVVKRDSGNESSKSMTLFRRKRCGRKQVRRGNCW